MTILQNLTSSLTSLLTLLSQSSPSALASSLIPAYSTLSTSYTSYVSSLISSIQNNISSTLASSIQKYKKEYSSDLQNLQSLNKSVKITSQSKIIVPNLSSLISSTLSLHLPTLPDVSLIHNLLTNIDLSLTKNDLNNKYVKKMIQEYQENKEELEMEFNDFETELNDFNNDISKIEQKILTKANKSLNKLYIAHLNYLNHVKTKNTDYNLFVNNKLLKCKQSELFNEFLK